MKECLPVFAAALQSAPTIRLVQLLSPERAWGSAQATAIVCLHYCCFFEAHVRWQGRHAAAVSHENLAVWRLAGLAGNLFAPKVAAKNPPLAMNVGPESRCSLVEQAEGGGQAAHATWRSCRGSFKAYTLVFWIAAPCV